MPARWMLYSHDTLGLGHVRRTIAIARAAIAARADVSTLLVTCSPFVDSLPIPRGLDYMKLPSARKAGPGQYDPRTLGVERERFCGLRAATLREACCAFAPHLLLVDKSPLGLMGELTETLATLKTDGDTRMVVGWRDILDTPEAMESEWREHGTFDVLERNYDEIWVYGDPRVFDVREEYKLPDRIAERIRFLGYLAPITNDAARARVRAALGIGQTRLAVVTVGGGEGGERVLGAWFEAADRGLLPADLRTVVMTGPAMPDAARRQFISHANGRTLVAEFVPGLEHLIAAADVVLGRAGYNTVCEAFGGATPIVLVPRVLHRDEQVIRARRLRELGLAEVVEEPKLTAETLASAVARVLGRSRPGRPRVKLNGLWEASRRVLELLPGAGQLAEAQGARSGFEPVPAIAEAHDDEDPQGLIARDLSPARWAARLRELMERRLNGRWAT
jgi:predicted glycosyltransferase